MVTGARITAASGTMNPQRRKHARAAFCHEPTRCELPGISEHAAELCSEALPRAACRRKALGQNALTHDFRRNLATPLSEFGRITNVAPRKEVPDGWLC